MVKILTTIAYAITESDEETLLSSSLEIIKSAFGVTNHSTLEVTTVNAEGIKQRTTSIDIPTTINFESCHEYQPRHTATIEYGVEKSGKISQLGEKLPVPENDSSFAFRRNLTHIVPQPSYSPDLDSCEILLSTSSKTCSRETILIRLRGFNKKALKAISTDEYKKCIVAWKIRWAYLCIYIASGYSLLAINRFSINEYHDRLERIILSELDIYWLRDSLTFYDRNNHFINL